MFLAREVRSESRAEEAECREARKAVRASEVRWAGETGGCWGGWEDGLVGEVCEDRVVVVGGWFEVAAVEGGGMVVLEEGFDMLMLVRWSFGALLF